MVMVTHDVGLRAFAHRVVHMLDGKIARVEVVPPGVRATALRELEAATAHTAAARGGEGAAAAAAPSQPDRSAFTTVRKPGTMLPSLFFVLGAWPFQALIDRCGGCHRLLQSPHGNFSVVGSVDSFSTLIFACQLLLFFCVRGCSQTSLQVSVRTVDVPSGTAQRKPSHRPKKNKNHSTAGSSGYMKGDSVRRPNTVKSLRCTSTDMGA